MHDIVNLVSIFSRWIVFSSLRDSVTSKVEKIISQEKEKRNRILLSAAKVYIQESNHDSFFHLRKMCGIHGLLPFNKLEETTQTNEYNIFQDSSLMSNQNTAKYILKSFEKKYGGFFGIFKHLSEQLHLNFVQCNPISQRMTAKQHLTSESFQTNTIQFLISSYVAFISNYMKESRYQVDSKRWNDIGLQISFTFSLSLAYILIHLKSRRVEKPFRVLCQSMDVE